MIKSALIASVMFSTSVLASDITTHSDDFLDTHLSEWEQVNANISKGSDTTISSDSGKIVLSSDLNFSGHYDVSMTFSNSGKSIVSQGLIFNYQNENNEFYSAHVKTGLYGKVIVYKYPHGASSGTLVYSSPEMTVDENIEHNLNISVISNDVSISLDGFHVSTLTLPTSHDKHRSGVVFRMADSDIYIDDFIHQNHTEFDDDFTKGISSGWIQLKESFVSTDDGLVAQNWGSMITSDDFITDGYFGAQMTWKTSSAILSPSILLGYVDSNTEHYSVYMKSGQYGRVVLAKHTGLSDGAGTVLESVDLDLPSDAVFDLEAQVRGKEITVLLDNEVKFKYLANTDINAGKVGSTVRQINQDSIIKKLKVIK